MIYFRGMVFLQMLVNNSWVIDHGLRKTVKRLHPGLTISSVSFPLGWKDNKEISPVLAFWWYLFLWSDVLQVLSFLLVEILLWNSFFSWCGIIRCRNGCHKSYIIRRHLRLLLNGGNKMKQEEEVKPVHIYVFIIFY